MQDFATQLQQKEQTQEKPVKSEDKNFLLATYVFFALGIFTGGVTTLIGIIMAYIKQSDYRNTIYESHITYLIRTFWLTIFFFISGFVLFFVGSVFSALFIFIGIGFITFPLSVMFSYLLYIWAFVWFIVRVVIGFISFYDNRPIARPYTWLF
ncbi:Predicted membrane protein [Oligella ureolytica]|uniref:Predicted membrane protein n=1 Tax=Oligella ureolytica TaxID=90244 RepID=A0A378XC32_9BURK|nr:hypothetical protein [Oligella ureolytica]QPT40494.1 hypothetical protein I6G29_02485 [Oligella ureolytica]SUA51304.1 Predicted membrane protein [Oligella ureolytica]